MRASRMAGVVASSAAIVAAGFATAERSLDTSFLDSSGDGGSSEDAGEPQDAGSGTPDAGAGDTFDGPVVTNIKGDFQARIVVEDGVVVDVVALAAGTSAAESQRINAEAIPALSARVLDAQSADVDAYSGASYSSPGFLESVAGAFEAAGL
ncbi:FMN-binding protein [Demequina sp. NBRC 110052]|uniref:FMN-binding protein n=1 Tax=Demequina sp. NBRC 110052 TaxID=1570341 RepID=UPI001356647D|nr:FMN-binding protein [Demequina sp. NBRC 110052]